MTLRITSVKDWIIFGITLALFFGGTASGLYFHAESYTDKQDSKLREDVCAQIKLVSESVTQVRMDIRELRSDLRADRKENK